MLSKHINKLVILVSLIIALVLYRTVEQTTYTSAGNATSLVQVYALTAGISLYLTLIIGPLSKLWVNQFTQTWSKSRKGLGISTFLFALLHSFFAFTKQLGGFDGLKYIGTRYLWTVVLGIIALSILLILVSISNSLAIKRLGIWWKRLQQLIYICAVLVFLHAFLLGTQFKNTSELIPQVAFLAVLLYLGLIFINWYRADQGKVWGKKNIWKFAVILVPVFFMFAINFRVINFSLHGYQAEKSLIFQKVFTTRFNLPDIATTDSEVTLGFSATEFISNSPVSELWNLSGAKGHIYIVDNQGNNFQHLLLSNSFDVRTHFTNPGEYLIFAHYQPAYSLEQLHSNKLIVSGDRKLDSIDELTITNITGSTITATDLELSTKQLVIKIDKEITADKLKSVLLYNIQESQFLFNRISEVTKQNGQSNITISPYSLDNSIKPGTYRLIVEVEQQGKIVVGYQTIVFN